MSEKEGYSDQSLDESTIRSENGNLSISTCVKYILNQKFAGVYMRHLLNTYMKPYARPHFSSESRQDPLKEPSFQGPRLGLLH